MTTRVLLTYPSSSPQQRILNDLIDLARDMGLPGQAGAMSIAGDDTEMVQTIRDRLQQARVATTAYNPAADLPATQSVVSNAQSVTVLPATGTTPAQGNATAAVANKAITGVRLPANAAVVTSGRTIAVTGGTVTLTVVNNVVTAAFTATP